MTIDEAIKHCRKVAWQNKNAAVMYKQKKEASRFLEKDLAEKAELDCLQCAAEHRQLAEWLKEYKDLKAEQNDQYVFINELMSELKEAKRLLNLALKDFEKLDRENTINKHCMMPEMDCDICPLNWDSVDESFERCRYWRYTNEAMNLIGKEGEQNA